MAVWWLCTGVQVSQAQPSTINMDSWLLDLSLNYKIKAKCILYLIEELHVGYTQQWEEEVTSAQQQASLKEDRDCVARDFSYYVTEVK